MKTILCSIAAISVLTGCGAMVVPLAAPALNVGAAVISVETVAITAAAAGVVIIAVAPTSVEDAPGDVLYDMQHAITKHGAEVEAVHNCLAAKGAFAHMINPVSRRTVDVCEIEPGLYGIEAHEPNGDLVTAFIDRARTTAAAVLAELARRGWQ